MSPLARFAARPFTPLLLAMFALLATISCQAQQEGEPLLELDRFPKASLEIKTPKEAHHFDIWIASTPQQQTQGLMFVRDLAENRGMLFIAEPARVFNMWMKNTYIPLDMVFISADKRIAKIAERTTPHSLATVSSDVPVAAILELKGGEASRRGLHKGDRVSWTPAQ
jgi:uncharacterized membrane protein (UPF0127 family)